MIAQLAQNHQHNFVNDQFVLALNSHRDINDVMIQDLDYQTLKDFVLFPNFIHNFDSFVHKLVLEHTVPMNVKLRYLAFLTSVKIFIAKDIKMANENLKYCFDLIIFVRSLSSNEQIQTGDFWAFSDLPIFHNIENNMLKIIKMLLKID